MGMTIEDVTKACGGNEPEYISDDRYYIQPVKSHPLFEGYVVWISETEGLYYIKGISREIQTVTERKSNRNLQNCFLLLNENTETLR